MLKRKRPKRSFPDAFFKVYVRFKEVYCGRWSDIEEDKLPVRRSKSLLLTYILSIRVAEWDDILVGEVISGRK